MASESSAKAELHHTGEAITMAQPGAMYCVGCGFAVSTATTGELPECPACGGESFRRGSIFDRPRGPKTASVEDPTEARDWLDEVRAELDQAGSYLAFDEGDQDYAVVRLEPGWTRIGRSRTADIRLDDATVSRRHALVVVSPSGGKLRALDDRSLNGLYINGDQVEWAVLDDGDELEVGRYRLHVVIA